MSRERTDTVMRFVIGLTLLASTCGACHSGRITMTPRPDTREIGVIRFADTVAFRQTLDVFQNAMPLEGAVCFAGHLVDSVFTTMDGDTITGLIMEIDSVKPAVFDSATDHIKGDLRIMHVYFPRGKPAGCSPPTIGLAHSHPINEAPCPHTHDDANVLFQSRFAWFSQTWCLDGSIETLLQDGRRFPGRWRP